MELPFRICSLFHEILTLQSFKICIHQYFGLHPIMLFQDARVNPAWLLAFLITIIEKKINTSSFFFVFVFLITFSLDISSPTFRQLEYDFLKTSIHQNGNRNCSVNITEIHFYFLMQIPYMYILAWMLINILTSFPHRPRVFDPEGSRYIYL